jgi:GAF domain-containing protein
VATIDQEKINLFNSLRTKITSCIERVPGQKTVLQNICTYLWKEVPYYDWVGFYIVSDQGNTLELGPYRGALTEHTRIPFGKGICGQVAESCETKIVQDVSKEDNYLSCSINVKSEIVVPVIKNGVIKAELDIDSHTLSPFTQADTEFLEDICRDLAGLWT